MDNDILLSICIPTYNRCILLNEAINRLVSQIHGMNGIELIISDNASSDKTELVVNKLKKRYPDIIYYRNEYNLGFDGNFLNCLEKAKGKYVWLLSDDDIVMEGAIEHILHSIKSNPVCIHLNSANVINEKPLSWGEPRYIYQGVLKYTDRNAYIKKMGIYCTFLSSLVFKKEFIDEIKCFDYYLGSNLLQSHVLLETMKHEGIYLIETFLCICARENKTVNYDIYETWIKNYSLLLYHSKRFGFSNSIIDEVLQKSFESTVFFFIIKYRYTCKNSNVWNKNYVKQYICRFPKLIKWYWVAVSCPKVFLPLIGLVYRIKVRLKGYLIKKRNG
jgi:glycosyltransferase involved in cell wall biosynthesis